MEEVTLARPTRVELGWWVAALLVVGVLGAWGYDQLWYDMHTRLDFDDAYMFWRYAEHVRAGLGVSWNLDGRHTYGQTAPLWGLVVVGLSFVGTHAGTVLKMGSGACAILATVAMAWAIAVNAQSRWMRRMAVAYPVVLVPLTFSGLFAANAINGMETMLAVGLVAAYLGLALAWGRDVVRAEVVAGVGLLLFLTRPEAALVVVVLPVLVWWLGDRVAWRSLALLLGLFAASVVVEMAVCRWYFGAALPLSFYMKSGHGYVGYVANWKPVGAAWLFVVQYRWYVAVLALCMRWAEWRLVMACVAPLVAVSLYLLTVTQIMGFDSRYSMPYLALLVVPALLMVDRRLAEVPGRAGQWGPRKFVVHGLAAALVLLCCAWSVPAGVARVLDRKLMQRKVGYEPVVLVTASGKTLPAVPYLEAMWAVTDTLMAPLPDGATIASSEVGYLGAHAPRATIIDIAGLNDTEIALHGFDMAALLARRPDVIWMPHPDYTYQRGLMLSDPALLEQYDVYAGAANYGLAVRKDSPYRAQIDAQMQALWARLYTGLRLDDDRVRSVHWTGVAHRLKG